MSNIKEQQTLGTRLRLLDMLDDKSMAAIKKFGHVYTDRFTGRTKIRVFNKNK